MMVTWFANDSLYNWIIIFILKKFKFQHKTESLEQEVEKNDKIWKESEKEVWSGNSEADSELYYKRI